MMSETTRICFVRHGETDWNIEQRMQGHIDLALNANGEAQAIAAGVRISGCTVHLVDAGVDTGPILAQAAVPVRGDDTVESLHRRIQRQEHRLLPSVVDAIARGWMRLGASPTVAPAHEPSDGSTGFVSPPFV